MFTILNPGLEAQTKFWEVQGRGKEREKEKEREEEEREGEEEEEKGKRRKNNYEEAKRKEGKRRH